MKQRYTKISIFLQLTKLNLRFGYISANYKGYNFLATKLRISSRTVKRYIDMLVELDYAYIENSVVRFRKWEKTPLKKKPKNIYCLRKSIGFKEAIDYLRLDLVDKKVKTQRHADRFYHGDALSDGAKFPKYYGFSAAFAGKMFGLSQTGASKSLKRMEKKGMLEIHHNELLVGHVSDYGCKQNLILAHCHFKYEKIRERNGKFYLNMCNTFRILKKKFLLKQEKEFALIYSN